MIGWAGAAGACPRLPTLCSISVLTHPRPAKTPLRLNSLTHIAPVKPIHLQFGSKAMAPRTRSQTGRLPPRRTRASTQPSSRPIYHTYHSDYPDLMHAYFMKYGTNLKYASRYAQANPSSVSTTAITPRSSTPIMSRHSQYGAQYRDPIAMKKAILCESIRSSFHRRQADSPSKRLGTLQQGLQSR